MMKPKTNNGKTTQEKYSYTNGISFKEVLDEIIMLLTQLPFSRD